MITIYKTAQKSNNLLIKNHNFKHFRGNTDVRSAFIEDYEVEPYLNPL